MKKIIPLLLAAGVIGGLIAYQQYNKPHRDIDSEVAVATLSADEIFAAFDGDENAANAKYLDQVVEISGTVDEVSADSEGNTVLILSAEDAMMGGVSATMDSSVKDLNISSGDVVSLKGRCTGMLMDVVLTNCFLVTK